MTRASSFPDGSPLAIRVQCDAGHRGEEIPRRLIMEPRRIEVVSIQDRWLAPDHRYFKLLGDDGGLYIIRHAPHQDLWQLVCYKSDPTLDHSALVSLDDHPRGTC